jgi:hypothetical protein
LDSQPTVQFNQSAIFQLDDDDRLTALLSVVGYPNLTGLTFTLTGADITFIRLGDGS